MKVSVMVLALNEIEGIRKVLPRISKDWYEELLIVDGGSTDGSIEEARRQGFNVYVQKERGMGAAFREGLEKLGGDIIVLFCPDGNFLPEKIPLLTEKIRAGYDICMVSRYMEGARSFDDDPVTALGNWMFTRLVNLLFNARTSDLLYNYRAYRREVLDAETIGSNDAWGTRVFIRSVRKRLKIAEIPGDEPARVGGTRKMSPLRNGLTELSCIFREFFRITRSS